MNSQFKNFWAKVEQDLDAEIPYYIKNVLR